MKIQCENTHGESVPKFISEWTETIVKTGTVEKFAPTITMPGGNVVQPPGWAWVLGFAIGGCQWAIDEIDSPEFKARYRLWHEENNKLRVEEEIQELEAKIARLKAKL